MNQKDKKAAYLLDEIGGIDDCYIAEAMKAKKKTKSGRVILILAACIAAIAIMLFSVAGAFVFGGIIGGSIRDDVNSNRPGATENLEEILQKESNSAGVTRVTDVSEIDLFGGSAYLIWQNGSENGYCLKKLSRSSLSALESNVGGADVGSAEDVLGTKVWISRGDGRVFTPYLKATVGNVGYGELFDYSPEIIPSERFNSCVSNLFG